MAVAWNKYKKTSEYPWYNPPPIDPHDDTFTRPNSTVVFDAQKKVAELEQMILSLSRRVMALEANNMQFGSQY